MKKQIMFLGMILLVVTLINFSSAATGELTIRWIIPEEEVLQFDNLRNFTHLIDTPFSNSITASGGTIDTYTLNDTTNFNIDAVTGLIKNTTRLNTIEKYWLEITVNNSVGNSTTGIFYINVVSGTICRYEKFGVYNIKIPFLKEVNCNRKFGVNNNE